MKQNSSRVFAYGNHGANQSTDTVLMRTYHVRLLALLSVSGGFILGVFFTVATLALAVLSE